MQLYNEYCDLMSCEFIERKGGIMKKIFAFLLVVCMVFSVTACTGTPTGDGDTTGGNSGNQNNHAQPEINEFKGEDYVIEWVDEATERDTRAALDRPTGDIYASEVYHFDDFDFSDSKTLDDVVHFPNLRSVSANGTTDLDFSPLSTAIYLKNLYLSDNDIDDLTFLSELTNLEYVLLSNNQITDITPLSGLVNLEFIDLDSNQITDVSSLENLTNLQTVHLVENNVADWLPTAHIEEVFGRGEFVVPDSGIYEGESYIGTWKASDSEHYITLNADGTCEAIYPGYEPQTGTFMEMAPTMLSIAYDDGENVILLYDGITITNNDRNIIYNPFESEIPEGLTPEERLAEFKETVIGTWTSDTTDYVITINEDDTFTFENTSDGDFDSGTYIIEIKSGVGYQVDFDGEKYSYLPLQFENDTFGVHVVDDRILGNSIIILVSENVFTLED